MRECVYTETEYDFGKVVVDLYQGKILIAFSPFPSEKMRSVAKKHHCRWYAENKTWEKKMTRNWEHELDEMLKDFSLVEKTKKR